MNRKDQQLIYEAYTKVLEAAPQSLGSRIGQGLKGWALSKLNKGVLSPFFAASQERLDADKEATTTINKQKAEFEAAYKQQTNRKYSDAIGAPRKFVEDYIKGNLGVDPADPEIAQFLRSNQVSDKDINEAFKKAYAERTKKTSYFTGNNSPKKTIQSIVNKLRGNSTFDQNLQTALTSILGDPNNTHNVYKISGKDVSLKDLFDGLNRKDAKSISQLEELSKRYS